MCIQFHSFKKISQSTSHSSPRKRPPSDAAVAAIAALQQRITELQEEKRELIQQFKDIGVESEQREASLRDKISALETFVAQKNQEVEKISGEAAEIQALLEQEKERNEELRQNISEVSESLDSFPRRYSRASPSPRAKRLIPAPFPIKSPKTSTPNSKSAVISATTDIYQKVAEYELLFSEIFIPPQVHVLLNEYEQQIVDAINGTDNQNIEIAEDELESIQVDEDQNEEEEDFFEIEKSLLASSLRLSPSLVDFITKNYLPLHICRCVERLKRLPKCFHKETVEMKIEIIRSLIIAKDQVSKLIARIEYLEHRKYNSSSPLGHEKEIHRLEIQLYILTNEMRLFRFK